MFAFHICCDIGRRTNGLVNLFLNRVLCPMWSHCSGPRSALRAILAPAAAGCQRTEHGFGIGSGVWSLLVPFWSLLVPFWSVDTILFNFNTVCPLLTQFCSLFVQFYSHLVLFRSLDTVCPLLTQFCSLLAPFCALLVRFC